MMDLAALRPSQIEQLIASISDEDITDILDGIADLLDNFESDGGADSDKIYMAAHLLSMTPIWSKIEAEALAAVLLHSDVSARAEFLKGLPNEYAKNVSYLMETSALMDPSGAVIGSWKYFYHLARQHAASKEQLLSKGILERVLGGGSKVSDEVVVAGVTASTESGVRVEDLLMRSPVDVSGVCFYGPMARGIESPRGVYVVSGDKLNYSPIVGTPGQRMHAGSSRIFRHENMVLPVFVADSDE